ncbi:hypothetical protein B0H14DRAFT_1288213 [Mycena olivaceomarginata]|nr:hypothetical protein B0H14DRAFT_1288213 [Mycena olivaceomarginata]
MSTFIVTSLYNDPHVAFLHIHNALSLLDTYPACRLGSTARGRHPSQPARTGRTQRDTWLSEGLLALGVYMEAVNSGRNGGTERENDKTRECSLVTLRLLVGLTHSDPVWCARLTKRRALFRVHSQSYSAGALHKTWKSQGGARGEWEWEGEAGAIGGADEWERERKERSSAWKAKWEAAGEVEEDSDEESDAAAKTDGCRGGARYAMSCARALDQFGPSG